MTPSWKMFMTPIVISQEKRSALRASPSHYLRLYYRMTDQLLGGLVNISASGLMVISELPLVIGQSFELTLVPPETLENPSHLNFRASSVWCKRDENPNYYLVGFNFVKVPEGFFERVKGYVAEKKRVLNFSSTPSFIA